MNRRDIDRLVDEEQAFYHGSSVPHKEGTVLVAKCRPTEFGDRTSKDGVTYESFVDQFKPEGSQGRECSLFMTRDLCDLNYAGASEDYVYEVEPLGHVDKVDFGQFGKLLWQKELVDNPKAETIARRYWSGEPVFDNTHVFEYLAPAFRVVRQVKPCSKDQAEAHRRKRRAFRRAK